MNVEQILMYLENISNGNLVINFFNHLIVIISILLCFTRIKCKQKIIFGSIIVLCISVVGNAIYYGGMFHLITFSIMTVFFIAAFIKSPQIEDVPKKNIYTAIALIFIILGIWYPEFTKVNSILSILFSPLGIAPCPTLLTIGGILNLYPNAFNKKCVIYPIILIIIYGIIGAFRFKVYYDVLLLILVVFSIINLRRKID